MKLIFAGGGTGGHLFPALALAEEFKRLDPSTEIVFAGAVGGLEEKVVPGYGYRLKLLSVEGIKRRKGIKRIKALMKAAGAVIEAIRFIRGERPDGVIGSGSYSSAPVVFGARLLGIKTAIIEQNALPGLTNRLLGKMVGRVYISFEESRGFFPGGRTILTGNPVRSKVLGSARERTDKSDRFTILVFGGSQGATAINAAFLDATEYLTGIWPGLRVIHQTGVDGYEQVRSAYKRKGLKAEVHAFIEDMGSAYAGADLVICRAGATSIAEITALALPSILIPYPFASDDHQTLNARSLGQAGAAVVIRQDKLTGATLADAIRSLVQGPKELATMKEKARRFGRPGAAGMIAENFLKMIKKA